MCFKHVKLRTTAGKCRYTDLLPIEHLAKPTFFVSHRWGCRFQELLDALNAHVAGAGPGGVAAAAAADATFVWIDILAVNQHGGLEQTDDLDNLKMVINSARATLLYVDPEGLVLTRIWCLYEIWKTALLELLHEQSRLEVCAPGLTFLDMERIIQSVDSEHAQATMLKDLLYIRHLIQQSLGTSELDRFLQDRLLAEAKRRLLTLTDEQRMHLRAEVLERLKRFGASLATLTPADPDNGAHELASLTGRLDPAFRSQFVVTLKLHDICHTIVHLDLSLSVLDTTGSHFIADAMTYMYTLQTLTLFGCKIGPEGMKAVSAALLKCQALEALDLSYNDMGPDGLASLARSLGKLPRLAVLKLSLNGIGATGAVGLAAALPAMPALQELYLDYNHMQCMGVQAVAEACTGLNALRIVSCVSNELVDSEKKLFRDLLVEHGDEQNTDIDVRL